MIALDGVKAFLVAHIYNELSVIIAVASIIVTVLLVGIEKNGKTKRSKRNKARIWIAIGLILACVLLTLGTGYYHNRYSVVPDIYGMTYDNAISALREAGLDGRLALASTNKNLANADTRVVWQSKDAGSLVDMGSNVMFVIDDNFAIEAIPLTAYALDGNTEDNTAYSWDWSADKSSENWSITVPIEKKSFYATTSYDSNGNSLTTGGWYNIDICAAAMNRALSQIVEETCTQYAPEIPVSDMFIVKKLIPMQTDNRIALVSFEDDSCSGVSILPRYLTEGKYQFAFCLCDNSGTYFEWEHTILIVSNED